MPTDDARINYSFRTISKPVHLLSTASKAQVPIIEKFITDTSTKFTERADAKADPFLF